MAKTPTKTKTKTTEIAKKIDNSLGKLVEQKEEKESSTDLANQENYSLLVDSKIDLMLSELNKEIITDRNRAVDIYQEMRELFLSGEQDPDFLRELNKAQENISQTTDNMIKILGHLAKMKSGTDRIQIAQISKTENIDNSKLTKADIIDIIERKDVDDREQ